MEVEKTYLKWGATHAHISWQNLHNLLITSSYSLKVTPQLCPWCWHWLYYWLERWQWGAVQVQRNIASGLRPPPPYSGDSQAGTGPQQAVTILCQVSQLPMIGTYRYSSGDWCEIMNPFLLTDILKVHLLCLRVIGFSSNIQFSNIVFCLNRIFSSFIMYRQFLRNEKTFSKSQRIKNVFPNIYNGKIWSELKSNIYLTSRMSKTF